MYFCASLTHHISFLSFQFTTTRWYLHATRLLRVQRVDGSFRRNRSDDICAVSCFNASIQESRALLYATKWIGKVPVTFVKQQHIFIGKMKAFMENSKVSHGHSLLPFLAPSLIRGVKWCSGPIANFSVFLLDDICTQVCYSARQPAVIDSWDRLRGNSPERKKPQAKTPEVLGFHVLTQTACIRIRIHNQAEESWLQIGRNSRNQYSSPDLPLLPENPKKQKMSQSSDSPARHDCQLRDSYSPSKTKVPCTAWNSFSWSSPSL